MNALSSLTNRVFLASALLVVATMAVVMYRVNASVTAETEADLASHLAEAASLVDEFSRNDFHDFVVKGQLIADLPVLKGAAATDDAPTVGPIARDYQAMIGAELFVVLGRGDRVLAVAGRAVPDTATIMGMLAECRRSADGTDFWPTDEGLIHAAAIPLGAGIGTLMVGANLDHEAALRLRAATRSDVTFVFQSQIVASSLDPPVPAALAGFANRADVFTVPIGRAVYIGRAQPVGGAGTGLVALVLRSRTDNLRFLSRLRWQIAITVLAAVIVATIVGYLVARTVTRPLRALSGTMREMAATGDLARALPALGRWDDEDVRLVATRFRQLTTALDKFQREASQRERLSSLGRLSTVVAHEVRNPLMIIKSSVRALRKHPARDLAAVADSLDEEVARLDEVVTGVLDFARPIRFDLAPCDLAATCRDAAAAARAAGGRVAIAIDAPATAPVVTDPERLRAVLVNVMTNAEQAMATRDGGAAAGDGAIRVVVGRGASGGWRVTVADRGQGIAPEHLARVFEPFFTTRRGGSGLGLAIARNVIEGLGGAIGIDSRAGRGTTVIIDLPDRPPAAEARA